MSTDGYRTMLDHVRALPRQLEAAPRLPGLDDVRPLAVRPAEVLVCGMGGSAIAADLLAPLAEAAGLRLAVRRDYGLPGWLRDGTPVVLSSYSGNTEETLAAAAAARGRDLPLYALTTGGELAALCARPGGPTLAARLPGGLPPRAALGHGLGALATLLDRLGAVPGLADGIPAAVAALDAGIARLDEAAGEDAPAAARLLGRTAVVYTGSAEAHAAGRRLKAQVNENAKAPVRLAELPEADHNDIVGWEALHARRDDFVLLLLRSRDESARATQRLELTRELLRGEFHAVDEFAATADSPLARILEMVQFGDYLSCYLASAAGIDPMPVARIDALKRGLAE